MVDKCAYQLFAALSPWGYEWGRQGIGSVLNEKYAPRVDLLTLDLLLGNELLLLYGFNELSLINS